MEAILDIVAHPLILPIAVAMTAGALVYVLSRWSPAVCCLVALTACVWVLISTVALAGLGEVSFAWTWTELTETVWLSVDLAATQLGVLVAIAAAAFAVLVSFYALRAMAGEYWEGKFYAYLLWALGGACTVGLAGNLLVLLVGWEIVTLMLFLMINQGRGDAPAGAAKTYGVLGFADACLLMAVVLLATRDGGTANLLLTRGSMSVGHWGAAGYAIYALILVAALAKAGAVPVHTWIPAAATGAPAAVLAFLPAALDKLLGIYLLATLVLRMLRPDWTLQVVMMTIGAVTVPAAVLMAMMQHNLKRLLSFHAVSQVGYMVLGIATGTPLGILGGLFHMLNNAIYKSNLFLMSGTIRRATGTDEVERMGGLARALPVTFGCGLVAAAAISGIPPFNGFASKWMIYQGTLEVHRSSPGFAIALVVVAVFGSALTLASFVKVMYAAFLSPRPADAPARARVRESFFLAAPMVVLAAACVLLGLAPQLVVNGVFAPAVEQAGLTVEPGGALGTTEQIGLWNPTQATGLILIGILIGAAFVWVSTRKQRVRVVRPFLAGEVAAAGDDRFRVPGTHFYQTIGDLPIIGGLLRQGETGAMDPYYWSGRHGYTFVQVLRRLHTGLISLYVAWCVAGLSITLVYLLLSAGD